MSSGGGASWQALHRGDASIFALELRADGAGYAVGQNGTVLRTADGGASWAAVDAGTQAILLGVHSSADGQVIATGMRDMGKVMAILNKGMKGRVDMATVSSQVKARLTG